LQGVGLHAGAAQQPSTFEEKWSSQVSLIKNRLPCASSWRLQTFPSAARSLLINSYPGNNMLCCLRLILLVFVLFPTQHAFGRWFAYTRRNGL
jgi:hypothetical protein